RQRVTIEVVCLLIDDEFVRVIRPSLYRIVLVNTELKVHVGKMDEDSGIGAIYQKATPDKNRGSTPGIGSITGRIPSIRTIGTADFFTPSGPVVELATFGTGLMNRTTFQTGKETLAVPWIERELILGRQFLVERWALSGLRGMRLISRPFAIRLPVELWGIILWYVMEPVISPHTYCDSYSYPELHLRLYKMPQPDFQDWFRCRLVCRTWLEILGPYPHLTFSNKKGVIPYVNRKGITSMSFNRYSLLFEIPPDQCQELMSRLTVLRIQQFSGWFPPPNSTYLHMPIDFSNVRCLFISGADTWPYFWPGLTEACPNLVSLTIQGKVYTSGMINLPHLESLAIHPEKLAVEVEVVWALPNLRHLSLYGPFYPERLLEHHGPLLHTLMIHSSHPGYQLNPTFWDHFISLRTIGVWARPGQTLVPPPPQHPLRHLTIFLEKEEPLRLELVKESLVSFPIIRDLSVQIPDIRKQEKTKLQALGKEFRVSIHFLPQFEPLTPEQSILSKILMPLKRMLWIPVKRFILASFGRIKNNRAFKMVKKLAGKVAFFIFAATLGPPAVLVEWIRGEDEELDIPVVGSAMAFWDISASQSIDNEKPPPERSRDISGLQRKLANRVEWGMSPHTYCDSDTYPELHFQFHKILPPDYHHWFRYRLVCRTWNEILGPYPHRTLSNKIDITSHTNTRGITSMHLKHYSILFEIPLEQYKELVSQLTVLRIRRFSGWTPPPNSRHPAGSVKFRNVRFLSISGSDTWPDFWPGLAEACPNLVSLTVQGDVHCSETINLPHLETLSIYPVDMRRTAEAHWDLPNLKHLSLYGAYYPKQLLETHGPLLHSLMVHSSHTDLSLTPKFWDRFVSLRTVGVWARSGQTLLPPSPEHPLRHLALFIEKKWPLRIDVIKQSLISFPLIRDLSIQIQDIRNHEKERLQALAKQFHVSIHLLPQAEPSPPPQTTLSMIFTPIKHAFQGGIDLSSRRIGLP
ncbi:16184_t:CDS:2, partial [Acaulospora colombiana]